MRNPRPLSRWRRVPELLTESPVTSAVSQRSRLSVCEQKGQGGWGEGAGGPRGGELGADSEESGGGDRHQEVGPRSTGFGNSEAEVNRGWKRGRGRLVVGPAAQLRFWSYYSVSGLRSSSWGWGRVEGFGSSDLGDPGV